MTLPYDIARCAGKQIDGQWRKGCEDCQRRTSPGNPYGQWHIEPPELVIVECHCRRPPDIKRCASCGAPVHKQPAEGEGLPCGH